MDYMSTRIVAYLLSKMLETDTMCPYRYKKKDL